MKSDLTQKAIAANIEALGEMLHTAIDRVAEADAAIRQGDQNQAIGAILDLHEYIETALILYRAALSLHRTGRVS